MPPIRVRNIIKKSDIIKLRQSLFPLRKRLKKIASTSRSVDDFIRKFSSLNLDPLVSKVMLSSLLSVNKQNYSTFLKSLPKLSINAKRDIRANDLIKNTITRVAKERTEVMTKLPDNILRTVRRMKDKGNSEESILRYINKEVPQRIDKQIDIQSIDSVHEGNSEIAKARADSIGVSTFIWRTQLDSKVRPMHADLEGFEFEANDPPICEANGEAYFPGTKNNCRCYAEAKVTGKEIEEYKASGSLIPTLGLLAGATLLAGSLFNNNEEKIVRNNEESLTYDPDLIEVDMSYENDTKKFNGEEIILQRESDINPKKGLYPKDRQIKREAAYAKPKEGTNRANNNTKLKEDDNELPLILLQLLRSDEDEE